MDHIGAHVRSRENMKRAAEGITLLVLWCIAVPSSHIKAQHASSRGSSLERACTRVAAHAHGLARHRMGAHAARFARRISPACSKLLIAACLLSHADVRHDMKCTDGLRGIHVCENAIKHNA